MQRSSDCSLLEVCLLPPAERQQYQQDLLENPMTAKPGNWAWQKVGEADNKGFEVPAGAKGLVRVGWQGRKGPGSRLNLKIKVWHQPRGNIGQREFDDLEVPSIVASPIMFMPPRNHVGTLVPNDSAVAEFTLWSATRDSLDLVWEGGGDPRFVYEKRAFSPEECRDLEKKLRKDGGNTRVRNAFHFQV